MMAQTKHFVNKLEECVSENLQGMALMNPEVHLIKECNALVIRDYRHYIQQRKVVLISGGGTGHEPMFAGYVGHNLLTAAVSGEIFAAPSSGKIIRAIEYVMAKDRSCEILLIVPNYTGDRLNFKHAADSLSKTYRIDMIVLGDDVAFSNHPVKSGKRSLSGLAIIIKLAGALADDRATVSEIKANLETYGEMMATMSLSMSSCNIPGRGYSFVIKGSQMELGLGAHGEAGVELITKLYSAQESIKQLLEKLFSPGSKLMIHITKNKNRIILLLNNMGGLSQFEMNILSREAILQCDHRNLIIERFYCGPYMTSFNMSGLSVTVMAVDNQILRLLDKCASSPGWTQIASSQKSINIVGECEQNINRFKIEDNPIDQLHFGRDIFICCVKQACIDLVDNEYALNDMDTACGDGGCGTTLANTAKAIISLINESKLKASFTQLFQIIQEQMGGTSGAIYTAMTKEASIVYMRNKNNYLRPSSYVEMWCEILRACIGCVKKIGQVEVGERTMLDALDILYKELYKYRAEIKVPTKIMMRTISEQVRKATELTKVMPAQTGRAAYVHKDLMKKTDPGAHAVFIWVDAIRKVFDCN